KIQAPIQSQAPPEPQAPSPAQQYGDPWPEDFEQDTAESNLSESKLTFDHSHFDADEPPIKFETGPIEGASAANVRDSKAALQTALRESGALRQVPAHEEPSLLEEFETLRQKAETKDQAAAASAARPPRFADPEPKAATITTATAESSQLIPAAQRESR